MYIHVHTCTYVYLQHASYPPCLFIFLLSHKFNNSETVSILYVLSAPSLLATVIVKYLRRIQTKGNDDGAIRLKNLHQFDYLALAIDNGQTGFKYIATDVPYIPDPRAPKPKPTQRQQGILDREKAELTQLKEKLQERARMERIQREAAQEQSYMDRQDKDMADELISHIIGADCSQIHSSELDITRLSPTSFQISWQEPLNRFQKSIKSPSIPLEIAKSSPKSLPVARTTNSASLLDQKSPIATDFVPEISKFVSFLHQTNHHWFPAKFYHTRVDFLPNFISFIPFSLPDITESVSILRQNSSKQCRLTMAPNTRRHLASSNTLPASPKLANENSKAWNFSRF